jgi:tRNA threonylcarbamoyladenosine biosynthesis protein TsaE
MPVFETSSAAETKSLGRRLAAGLKPGCVVAFYGELGAGKTTMIKGVAEGLGVRETVKSPSYVMATVYEGVLPVSHVDLYRVSGPEGLESIDLDGYISEQGVCLIEWADRAEETLPEERVNVYIEVSGTGRKVTIKSLCFFSVTFSSPSLAAIILILAILNNSSTRGG